jgi:flagellar biogenesis protein FliO
MGEKRFGLFSLIALLAFLAFLAYVVYQMRQSPPIITTEDIQKARAITRRLEHE